MVAGLPVFLRQKYGAEVILLAQRSAMDQGRGSRLIGETPPCTVMAPGAYKNRCGCNAV